MTVDSGSVTSKAKFWGRATSRKVASFAAAATLVTGVMVGSGSANAGNADTIEGLEFEIAALTTQVEEMQDEVKTLASDAELSKDQAEVLQRTVDERDAQITGHLEALGIRDGRIAELEAAVAAAAAAPRQFVQPSAPQQKSAGSAYYQNCTAARQAGAAPVRRGDPGYGPHLDRDGDGVGCE